MKKKDSKTTQFCGINILWSALWFLLSAVLILMAATLIIGIRLEKATFPLLLGNRPRVTDTIRSQTDPNAFRFVVMGDVKDSTATFKSLLTIAQQEKPAFVVILGDIVNERSTWNHRLFAEEVSQFASIFPILLVPGNHDLGWDYPFGIAEYENMYGPIQFSFSLGANLFIFLNDLQEYNSHGEYLDYLEKVLEAHRAGCCNVFVFTHIPPGGLSDVLECSAAPDSERFLRICRDYHVDYVFAGDHHGYLQTVVDGTTYIVSGGGGARLRGGKGCFHHCVEMTLNNQSATDTIITVEHRHGSLELLERNIVLCLWEPIRENITICFMSVLYCCAAIFTFWILAKRKINAKIRHIEP